MHHTNKPPRHRDVFFFLHSVTDFFSLAVVPWHYCSTTKEWRIFLRFKGTPTKTLLWKGSPRYLFKNAKKIGWTTASATSTAATTGSPSGSKTVSTRSRTTQRPSAARKKSCRKCSPLPRAPCWGTGYRPSSTRWQDFCSGKEICSKK